MSNYFFENVGFTSKIHWREDIENEQSFSSVGSLNSMSKKMNFGFWCHHCYDGINGKKTYTWINHGDLAVGKCPTCKSTSWNKQRTKQIMQEA